MLRLISKQAQLLTTKDDAALMQPYRQVGQGVKRHLKERGQEKQRRKWDNARQQGENMRDPANGFCRLCKRPLAPSSRGSYCPDPACNTPRYPNRMK